MRPLALVCLVLLLTSARTPAAQPVGSLTGQVLDAATGRPIANAEVALLSLTGPDAATRNVRTDVNGHYAAAGLPPGLHLIQAFHVNYPGPLGLPQRGILAAIEDQRDTTASPLRLDPGGAVVGRILDDAGEPLSGCSVQITQARIGAAPEQAVGAVAVDGRGEFRIAPVAPDRYLWSAECHEDLPAEHLLDVVGPHGFETRSTWGLNVYPDSPTFAGASEVAVPSGGEVRVEFHMRPQPVATISGLLEFTPGAASGQKLVVYLETPVPGRDDLHFRYAPVDPVSHTFYLGAVPMGSHELFAAAENADGESASSARLAISVDEAKSYPVRLRLELNPELTGTVETPESSAGAEPIKGTLSLTPAQQPSHLAPVRLPVSARDGKFHLATLTPGRWRVRYQATQGPTSVISMQFGDTRVENDEIEVTPGTRARLRIRTGGPNPAVHFELRDPAGDAHQPWILAALPTGSSAGEPHILGIAIPGQALRLTSLPPGRHHLVAVPKYPNGVLLNERTAALLRRHTPPLTIQRRQEQPIAIPCFSYDAIRALVDSYLAGANR